MSATDSICTDSICTDSVCYDSGMYTLYAIVDSTCEHSLEAAIRGGVTLVQIREKNCDRRTFLERAEPMCALAKQLGVPVVINDDPEVARALDADGVHLGQGDMPIEAARSILGPGKCIGVSAGTVEEALEAARSGADYIGVGAVFQTQSKSDAEPIALETVRKITELVNIPVVAIGGINEQTLPLLEGSGVSGIAVISGIFSNPDSEAVASAAHRLREATEQVLELKCAHLPAVLTIAGSDCSGGAGIQADLKTIAAHGLYGMSAITAITAQNTQGVFAVEDISPDCIREQIEAVYRDIPPKAVKIGMVSRADTIQVIADALRALPDVPIVLDPVMVSTSGHRLLDLEALDSLTSQLFPMATVLTPNIPEAELLCGFDIKTIGDIERAARVISERYAISGALLIKGGHLEHTATDVVYLPRCKRFHYYRARRIQTSNTHGTGCTLSSAIACALAEGLSVEASIYRAKCYVAEALSCGLDIGKGSGPLHHLWPLRRCGRLGSASDKGRSVQV